MAPQACPPDSYGGPVRCPAVPRPWAVEPVRRRRVAGLPVGERGDLGPCPLATGGPGPAGRWGAELVKGRMQPALRLAINPTPWLTQWAERLTPGGESSPQDLLQPDTVHHASRANPQPRPWPHWVGLGAKPMVCEILSRPSLSEGATLGVPVGVGVGGRGPLSGRGAGHWRLDGDLQLIGPVQAGHPHTRGDEGGQEGSSWGLLPPRWCLPSGGAGKTWGGVEQWTWSPGLPTPRHNPDRSLCHGATEAPGSLLPPGRG